MDFCELCTRAGFPTMQVVPRPHRPPTPNVIPQDNTPVGKQDKKDGMLHVHNIFYCNIQHAKFIYFFNSFYYC